MPYRNISDAMIRDEEHDQRRCVRISLSEPARLLVGNDDERECTVIDVSLAGVALNLGHSLPAGTHCMTSFDITVFGTRRRVNAFGEFVYTKPLSSSTYRSGVKFLDMDGYSLLLLRELTAE